MKKINFDDYTGSYNELLRRETRFFSSDEDYFAKYKVLLARKLIHDEPRRILEFGCGIGRNLPFLRDVFKTAEIMGSDISEKSIESARLSNKGIYCWNEGNIADEKSDFDLIFVVGVFHHILPTGREEAMGKIYHRLAIGGNLLIFEHNPYNPITRKIVNTCPYDQGVILLKPRQLRRHIDTAGLTVLRQGYSLFFPPRFKKLNQWEKYLSSLPLGGQYWIHAVKR
jgi:SAM-dependent methyltransferase